MCIMNMSPLQPHASGDVVITSLHVSCYTVMLAALVVVSRQLLQK
jgi:hypothetical protein